MNKLVYFLTAVLILSMIAMGAYIWQNEQDKQSLRSQLATPTPTPQEFEVPTATPLASPMASNSADQVSTGSIIGSISFPSEQIPEMQVCAENTNSAQTYCTDEMLEDSQYQNGLGYRLDVPEGSYTVYAKLPNDSYKAYYSEFVTCGLKASCVSHDPITIVVTADKTTDNIDPQDWYNQ